jgi:multidrug efflux pump subunit AcrB
MRAMRQVLPNKFPGATFYFQNADIVTQVLNFGLPAPIDVQIQDPNFERAQAYAGRVRRAIEETPGAVDVRQLQVLNYPALRVEVDRVRAARLGLTQRDVANNVLTSLSSSAIVSPSYFLNPNGVNYVVAVQTPIERLQSVDDLMATAVTTATGSILDTGPAARPNAVPGPPTIRLSNLATLKPETSYQSVSHYTVQRVIDIAANIDGRDLGGVVEDIKKKIAAISSEKEFPSAAKIIVRGQYEVMNASFESLIGGLILAIILVYALLVVLFQSWVDPFIIMMAVPGALIGILWMLALTGTTINVMSLMGAIMAVGIGVSNAILVVSFANELRAEKEIGVIEAAIEAGKTRLRPVLMTALAMIIGMVPMALGVGEAGEQNAPLGRAVIGGLLLATVATLFVVPVIYTFVRKKMPILHQLDARFAAESQGRTA